MTPKFDDDYPATPRRQMDRLMVYESFSDGGNYTGPRKIMVYLPSDYNSGQHHYPVIYFHDGMTAFTRPPHEGPHMGVEHTYDKLYSEGLIRPAILVGIDNVTRQTRGRDAEACRNGYIANHLKPFIDGRFRTKPEPASTGIVGFSFGGYTACYLGYLHPETFGMAGCLASSLQLERFQLLQRIMNDTTACSGVRFWFQAGGKEPHFVWQSAIQAVRALIARGWTEGSDVAYQHSYEGLHDLPTWAAQMRDMLYFFLRKTPPNLLACNLLSFDDSSAKVIDLAQTGEAAYPSLELRFENGFRINAAAAEFVPSDGSVIFVNNHRFGNISPLDAGQTTVSAMYGDFESTLKVKSLELGAHEKFSIPTGEAPVEVDGSLGEWATFPYVAEDEDCELGFRFAIVYDDRFLYLAIDVRESNLMIRPEMSIWEQDGLRVCVDARPDPVRSLGRGCYQYFDYLDIGITPSTSGRQAQVQDVGFVHGKPPDIWTEACLPSELKVACKKTSEGFSAELAIPVDYLNEVQEAPWMAVRLNVCQRSFDELGGKRRELWWRPSWRSDKNEIGSGTFVRSESASI